MEGTDNKTNLDEKTLGMIADFNSITQNQDQRIAQHYLEMSAYDLNVHFFSKFIKIACFFIFSLLLRKLYLYISKIHQTL